MASWEELQEALQDYTVQCNTNERLRKMQRAWSRRLHFACDDSEITFTMVVDHGEITQVLPGHLGEPDIIVTTSSETFCDMFWGDLNPVQKYLRGEIKVQGSQEDVMRLDAISSIIWPES
ncbi:MAG: SCP2 sterol-binding domain-containing protein [Actinobacteria bacterium]|nr:SCP2 sterol-binding domain-containing protein [Actinomycetota bacterium]